MISTGALTDLVVATLADLSGQEIGDGVAPVAGGWLEGQPNVSAFVPYSVVMFAGASPREVNLTFDSTIHVWTTSWSLRHWGGSRTQVDWVATQVRSAVEGLLKETFEVGAESWQVQQVVWQALGAVTRNDQVDPPFWNASDTFILHAGKQG